MTNPRAAGYRSRVSVLRPAVVAVAAALALSGCGNLITRDLTPPSAGGDNSSTTPVAAAATPTKTPAATLTPSPTATATTTRTASPTAKATPTASAATPVAPAGGIQVVSLVAPAASSSIPAGTWGFGDSFMLGSKKVLTAHHVVVDAKTSRQFYEGIPLIIAAANAGTLPRNVLIHLGTNGTVTSRHCDHVMKVVGPHRRVFFVTVIGPRSWMAPNDVVFAACQAKYPRQIVLVDWAGVSAHHPEYFGPDHVHPNPTGRKIYNALLLGALSRYSL